ncbi:MAG: DUF1501 domain-containing protein [Methylococcales bacterium]
MNTLNFQLSRRQFIKLTGSAGLALLLKPHLSNATVISNPLNRRVVFLEMNGGNDGLNTVIPYSQGRYYDLRPKLAIPEASVLPLTSQVGLHPALKQLHSRFQQGQVAILQGIGHPKPDLSHFAMMEYWRSGHPQGMSATNQTGWLGRVLDTLAPAQEILSGLSLATSIGPVLANKSAVIAALTDVDSRPYVPWQYENENKAIFWPLLNGLTAGNANDPGLLAASKKGMRHSQMALDLLPLLTAGNVTYPDTETSRLLDLAARILTMPDVKVLHIPLPMDFDTHSNQAKQQAANFVELDTALDYFLNDLAYRNLADQVIVVMVSEFGRRVAENKSLGTDHGAASNAFVIGSKVLGGLYGQQPSLTDLDADDNLKMSMSYLDLLATVSENWLGVNAQQIVPGGQKLTLFN